MLKHRLSDGIRTTGIVLAVLAVIAVVVYLATWIVDVHGVIAGLLFWTGLVIVQIAGDTRRMRKRLDSIEQQLTRAEQDRNL